MKNVYASILSGLILLMAVDASPASPVASERHGEVFRVERDAQNRLPLRVEPLLPARYSGSPAVAAQQFLVENAEWLGVLENLDDYQALASTSSPGGNHILFGLHRNGREVVNAFIQIHLDWENRPVLVQLSAPLPGAAWPDKFPDYVQCLEIARRDFIAHNGYLPPDKTGKVHPTGLEGELDNAREVFFLEDGKPVPAWELRLVQSQTPANATYCLGGEPLRILAAGTCLRTVTGTGAVFDPNPVNTLNDSSLRNNFPESAFTAAYAGVDLLELADPVAGKYALTGPWVKIVSRSDEPPIVLPPSETAPAFTYVRTDPGFNAVMAYYWLDRSQRYIQNLGFDTVCHYQINADVHGAAKVSDPDNSYFLPEPYGSSQGYLAFGDGGIPDAQDADVILHEYAHAMQNSIKPYSYLMPNEAMAIGEGFGDYWTFSFTYELSLAHGFDPYCFGEWDARGATPVQDCWRRLDTEKIYPDSLIGEEHSDGEIWSCALKNIFLALGREVADNLAIESHFWLPNWSQTSFKRGAQAMVDADRHLYGGTHIFEVCQEFLRRGIFTAADCRLYGPFLDLNSGVIQELDGNGNGIPEPGELLQLTLPLTNSGIAGTGPVTARLASSGGVVIYVNQAGYGSFPAYSTPQNPGIPFQFKIKETTPGGELIPFTVTLSFDGHTQTWSYNLQPGQFVNETVVLSDNLETQTALWQEASPPGSSPSWVWKTGSYYHNGSKVWFAPDSGARNDAYLIHGALVLDPGYWYTYSFWQTYKLEGGFDGGVLEITTTGTNWQDLGNHMLQNGYTMTISTEYSSPISGRSAWSGGSLAAMKQVLVDLHDWAGQTVGLRFRMASDSSTASSGWYMDDVSLIRKELQCPVFNFIPGDLNRDGNRNAADLVLLSQLLAENIQPGQGSFQRSLWAADMNEDARVDATDLLLLGIAQTQ